MLRWRLLSISNPERLSLPSCKLSSEALKCIDIFMHQFSRTVGKYSFLHLLCSAACLSSSSCFRVDLLDREELDVSAGKSHARPNR